MNFDWLKALAPRGIYARAALILFLPITIVTLVVTVMFLQRHFEDVTAQMTNAAAREVGFVARRIEQSNSLIAAQLAGRAVAGPLGISLRLPADPPAGDRRYPIDLSGRAVIKTLHERVDGLTGVNLRDDRRVVIGIEGRWGPYVLSFDRSRVSASNPHQLLVLTVLASAVTTLISTIFLRNQLRPIRRLARAAEDFGRGRMTPYRPSGATEVRIAGTAFLDMRNRLARQAENRRLMLSGISHDLRTPLTRLRLGLSMLEPDAPPAPGDVAAMQADVDEMGSMVDAFLEFARDDAVEVSLETIHARTFLDRALDDAARAGQTITPGLLEIGAQAEVTVNPQSLARAINNLVGNATRHGRRVVLDSTLTERAWMIAIEDDGPGIPQDDREEALRPFSRLDTGRNRDKSKGMGLGLSIALDIARAHGGTLRLLKGPRWGGLRAEIVLPR